MLIKLPSQNGEECTINYKNSIVIIGANGSGKTRMSTWIENNNPDLTIHRISAQKSLNMPDLIAPTELETATEIFLYGLTNDNKRWLKQDGKNNYRWGKKPETHLLNDYEALMQLLVTDNYQKSIDYRTKHKSGETQYTNETHLEIIQRIWEFIITHRKLNIEAGKITVNNLLDYNDKYNGSEMSDGERAIFYFIGEVISVPQNTLIIIDEPENHLHNAILISLWNAIEAERPDCAFIYITHNLQFATSRINSELIWVKNMIDNNTWDYQILSEEDDIDELKLQILGSRQKILLVEGTSNKSTDRKVYSALFKEYNIIPVDNCNRVTQYVKAYNGISGIHYGEVKGIIDRDRLSQADIDSYRTEKIYAPEVAEIENLFLLDEVIEFVATQQNKPEEEITTILNTVHSKTFEFLQQELENQSLLFTKQAMKKIINKTIHEKTSNLNEYKSQLSKVSELDIDSTFLSEQERLQVIVDNQDYLEALKAINNKGLLPYTKLSSEFGWKKDYYIDYVIGLLNSTKEDYQELKDIFRCYIIID